MNFDYLIYRLFVISTDFYHICLHHVYTNNINIMKNSASIKPILYIHKTLKNGKHPIVLQVIKDRKVKKISLGYSAFLDEWDFKNNKPTKKYANRLELDAVIKKKEAEFSKQALAFDLADASFTADSLVKSVKHKRTAKTVFSYFEEVVSQMKKANRIGNSEVYQTCKNVLTTFSKKNDLQFTDIDFTFLTKFENYCKEKGWKESSISSYMRTLRALFNRAIHENLIAPDVYPFKQYKIGKLNTDTQKRAIRLEQIQEIEKLELLPNTGIFNAKNIFLFSFYTMGTNLVDIANITWENIHGGRLKYIRAKTHKPYNIVLTEKAKQILKYYKSVKTDKYIFPIYSEGVHVTAQQQANRLHKVMQNTNEDLKEIARKCKIKENLTTYVARHSAATILNHKGVSTTVISELLGHETEGVTQVYLDSFESPVLDTAVSLL